MGFAASLKLINLKMKLMMGEIDAAYELAQMYLSDSAPQSNIEAGLKYLTQAAQGNIEAAQLELAQYYLVGKNVTQSTEIALDWLLKASDNGSKNAWLRLSSLISTLEPHYVFQWCNESTRIESRHALILLGNYYCEDREDEGLGRASDAYIKAINKGASQDRIPITNISKLAKHYYFIKKDESSAAYWANIGADMGDPQSKYIMGRCLFSGTAISKNLQMAFGYFKDAAERGITDSKLFLAHYYMNGYGVTQKDPVTAIQLYHEISSFYPEVFNYIGRYYLENNDVKNAAINYEKADNQGTASEIDGEFYTLSMYFDKLGDFAKAVHWLNLSSKRNTPEARFLLSQYYFYGQYFDKNTSKGIEIMEDLADINYQPALRKLYDIYENGEEGLEQDKIRAFSFLTRLAKSGDAEAIVKVGNTYIQENNSLNLYDPFTAAGWFDKLFALEQESLINYEYLERIGLEYLFHSEYKAAYKWLCRAEKAGSKYALFALGECYFKGLGTRENLKKAFKYFNAALLENIEESKVYLGRFYLYGYDATPTNEELGLQLLNEASANHPLVFNYIGKYFLDIGDAEKAVSAYEKACAEGILRETEDEFLELAKHYDSIQDYEKAIQWLNRSSQKDAPDARFLVAQYYLYGCYFAKDVQKALEELNQLACEGYPPALYLLYDIYHKGHDGIEKDENQALSILHRLVEAGDAKAIIAIGNYYMQGDSPLSQKDYRQAAHWYEKWYKQKNNEGKINAEYLLEIGKYYGALKDYTSARKWLARAAEEGLKEAYVILGNMAAEYERDDVKAFKYYSKASDIPEGMAYLAYCYYSGKGTNIDYSLAYRYFSSAAEKGNSIGLYGQAFCLLNSVGVESTKDDDIRIFTLLKNAAENRYTHAYELLAECYELGIGTKVSVDKAIYYLCKLQDNNQIMRMLEKEDYTGAYAYAKDREECLYHKMILTYFGKGTPRNVKSACEMFVKYYRSNQLNDICGLYQTRPSFKFRIAEDVIAEGIGLERNKEPEKAIEYYKAALRFNPKAGVYLARILFEQEQLDSIPLLLHMSQWNSENKIYRNCRSIANNMLGLYYEYYYSKLTKPQTQYTSNCKVDIINQQNLKTAWQYYMGSSENEAYKRLLIYKNV